MANFAMHKKLIPNILVGRRIMQICSRIVNPVVHIIKEFIDFRMLIASLGAKVVLRGPIQGTITSEIENEKN